MMRIFLLGAVLVLAIDMSAAGQPGFELGVRAGGGMTWGFGDWQDAQLDDLTRRGNLAGAKGSAVYEFTPSWQAGAYARLTLGPWFRIGLEPRMEYLGTSFLATTDTGQVWERYSLAVPVVLIPVSARAYISHELGEIDFYLAPALAVLAGQATILERQANSSSSRQIVPSIASQFLFLAASAGIESRWWTSSGWWPAIGISYDMAVTPVSPATSAGSAGSPGFLGAGWYPCSLNLYLSLGWAISEYRADERRDR
mgnify:CR=1 FL=1